MIPPLAAPLRPPVGVAASEVVALAAEPLEVSVT